AAVLSGYVAGLTAPLSEAHVDPHLTLTIYSHVFTQIGIVTGIIALIMLLTARRLHKMTLATDEELRAS
ncbi:MAG: dipeptide/tripeptide permease, partial [Enterobacteriaceae bacterium]